MAGAIFLHQRYKEKGRRDDAGPVYANYNTATQAGAAWVTTTGSGRSAGADDAYGRADSEVTRNSASRFPHFPGWSIITAGFSFCPWQAPSTSGPLAHFQAIL